MSDDEFNVEFEPQDTIDKVKYAIEKMGHKYVQLEADYCFYDNLKKTRPDLVLNRAEGLGGESRESHIPAFCEMLGVPYVGSGVMANAIGLDKPTTKMILEYHGLKTSPFQVFYSISDPIRPGLKFPLILKPSHEGSSIGINWDNVVHDEEKLRVKLREMLETYDQPILCEEFIDGREFSVGLYGNFSSGREPSILPILEVDFSKFPKELGNVLGQKAKTIFDSSKNYLCPAPISEELRARIEKEAKRAFRVLNCKDWARIDYRMNKANELFFLEVNTLPGIDYNVEHDELSFYPMMWYAAGMDFNDMIQKVVEAALERYATM
ncbi:ATP-grasp domain-containing protein [Candidatus Bathyarchaeota archaeon]|jgi:D-alanine-D-alanine ligase|nr:ATP-grasp domain-containing protein [Candidatus Bathyarchaeota archaeon]